ncbi:hypothetical protein FRZ67_21240 [Panacibacter ginsenosidivorans]|uniref:Helix-turn-helix domain-containing protein n=2 Tax=Panacibacter ginsenosidivorans TaxID=1813871 RepID=A0A5B8VH27_9BACT|nr:hypothetical protein FRZ67_21240 [Panacibacter ginsenosidivorans]
MQAATSFIIAFYKAIDDDTRITAKHISLYMALFVQWNLNQCKDPIYIKREVVMKAAKISARHTYNKHINELHKFGYIKYLPTSNPLHHSIVYIKQLQ